jgi:hypothetical protein
MSNASQNCPKCNGQMEQGFVLDKGLNMQYVSQWAAGPPQKSFWLGTSPPDNLIPIGAFRCASCGYLESYARPEFAAR